MIGTATQTAQFKKHGLIKVEGLIERADALRAQTVIYSLARQQGLKKNGHWIKSASRFGLPKPFRNALGSLGRSANFPDLINEDVRSLAATLVGGPIVSMPPGQQILFTLPGEQSWAVPHDVWHLDLPRCGEQKSPGLQVFTFIEDVEPSGGATLVVGGSHRLLNDCGRLPSKKVKQLLSREQYFKTLFDPSRPATGTLDELTGSVADIELKVIELCGKVGDVYLMDLRVLHTPAPNAANNARMMLTCRLPRPDVLEEFAQPKKAS